MESGAPRGISGSSGTTRTCPADFFGYRRRGVLRRENLVDGPVARLARGHSGPPPISGLSGHDTRGNRNRKKRTSPEREEKKGTGLNRARPKSAIATRDFADSIVRHFSSLEDLFDSQVRQNLGILLLHRQHGVTRVAVVRDSLAVGARVASVVTPEASREIRMTQIVGIRTPGDVHRRENITEINRLHAADRSLEQSALLVVNIRVRLLIEGFERGRNVSFGSVAIWIVDLERGQRLFLDVGQFRTDVAARHGLVERGPRQLECVSWTVVAVDAIHRSVLSGGELLRRGLRVGLREDRSLAGRVVNVADLGYLLAVPINRDVLDAPLGVQVTPVNAQLAIPGVAADLEKQDGGEFCVLFVFFKVPDDDQLVAREGLRIVALLARLARRPQIRHGHRDRPFVGMKRHGIDLPEAGKLRADEPGRAGADVTLNAFNAGVRRTLIRRKFGLHHRVARLPAESHRIHVLHSAIGSDAEDDDVCHSQARHPAESLAKRRNRKINLREGAGELSGSAKLEPVHQRAGGYQQETQDKDPGKNQKEDEANVRMKGTADNEIEQPEGDQRDCRTRGQDGACQAQRIAAKVSGGTNPEF